MYVEGLIMLKLNIMTKHNFKKLLIWQESMSLVVETYDLTKKFPSEEKFGLISQLNRCSVSIPSNNPVHKIKSQFSIVDMFSLTL